MLKTNEKPSGFNRLPLGFLIFEEIKLVFKIKKRYHYIYKKWRKMSKVKVESFGEVYYPTVFFVKTKTEKEKASEFLDKGGEKTALREAESTVILDAVKKAENPRRQRRVGLWFSKLGTIMIGMVAIVAVVLVGFRVTGFRTFTVMSGSMEPEYPVGALIYVKPVDYKALKVGDVISYVANDDKTVVTHRIVEVETDLSDSSTLRFKTKGDANKSADSKLVHYKNVLGSPIIVIPLIGYFAHNIQQPPGIYIALVVGTLLLAWTFLPGTLEERRKTARKSIA